MTEANRPQRRRFRRLAALAAVAVAVSMVGCGADAGRELRTDPPVEG